MRTCPPAVAWPQKREGLGEWGSSPELQMTSDLRQVTFAQVRVTLEPGAHGKGGTEDLVQLLKPGARP